MILVTGIGWLVQYLTGLENLIVFALLSGLLIAPFIPSKASCSIR